jgi:ubiquinone/menaquinone biosynthesis C-methylase UbiE
MPFEQRNPQIWEREIGDYMRHPSYYSRNREKVSKLNQPAKEFLTECFKELPNEIVLDIGSGCYTDTYLPESHIPQTVCFERVDIKKLNDGEKIFTNKFKEIIIGDAEKLPFPDKSFGIVLMKDVYSYLENPDKVLEEAVRVLKPNGLLTIIDFEGDLMWIRERFNDFRSENMSNQIRLLGFENIQTMQLDELKPRGPGLPKIDGPIYWTAITAKKNA